jgi:hypothetical protein
MDPCRDDHKPSATPPAHVRSRSSTPSSSPIGQRVESQHPAMAHTLQEVFVALWGPYAWDAFITEGRREFFGDVGLAVENMQRLAEDVRRELRRQNDQHREEIERLERRHAADLRLIRDEHEEALRDMRETLTRSLDNIRRSRSDELEALRHVLDHVRAGAQISASTRTLQVHNPGASPESVIILYVNSGTGELPYVRYEDLAQRAADLCHSDDERELEGDEEASLSAGGDEEDAEALPPSSPPSRGDGMWPSSQQTAADVGSEAHVGVVVGMKLEE